MVEHETVCEMCVRGQWLNMRLCVVCEMCVRGRWLNMRLCGVCEMCVRGRWPTYKWPGQFIGFRAKVSFSISNWNILSYRWVKITLVKVINKTSN